MLDVTQESHYPNTFCGDLICIHFITGIPSNLMAGYIMDKTEHIVKLSRLACCLNGLLFLTLSLLIQMPSVKFFIILVNLAMGISYSFTVQSLIQINLKSMSGIVSVSFIMALLMVSTGIVTSLLSAIFEPLRDISPAESKNLLPMDVFAILNILMNLTFAILYNSPDKGKLREQVESTSRLSLQATNCYLTKKTQRAWGPH